MIKEIGSAAKEKTGKSELNFLDHMDDGTPLQLTVAINPDKVIKSHYAFDNSRRTVASVHCF